MATINITDLNLIGSDLFMDSESYMSDLAADELGSITGGKSYLHPSIAWTPASSVSCAVTIVTVSTAHIIYEALK